MKKILLIIVILIATLCLTGCNYQVVDLHYEYNDIVCNYDGDKFTLHIVKWADYEGEQLQVVATDGKTYLLSANHCYMVDN